MFRSLKLTQKDGSITFCFTSYEDIKLFRKLRQLYAQSDI